VDEAEEDEDAEVLMTDNAMKDRKALEMVLKKIIEAAEEVGEAAEAEAEVDEEVPSALVMVAGIILRKEAEGLEVINVGRA